MPQQRSARTTTLQVSAIRVVGVAGNAGAFWFTARLVSPGRLGPVVAWISALAVAQVVLDLGMTSYSIRELSRDPGWSPFAAFRRVRRYTSAVVVVVAALVLTRGHVLGLAGVSAACLIGYLAAHNVGDLRMCPAMAAGRQTAVAFWQAAERIVTLAVVVGVGVAGLRQAALPVAMLGGGAVYLVGSTTVTRFIGSTHPGPGRRQLAGRCRHFLVTATGSQVQNLDVGVVSAIAGATQAGFYGVPSRLTNPLTLVVSSYCSVLYPAVSREPTRERVGRTLRDVARLGAAAAVVYGAGAVLAGPLIRVALGREYLGAVGATRIILIAMVALTLTMPLATLLQAMGRERAVARTIALTSLVGIPVTALGANAGGATGAATGWLAGQLVVLVQFVFEVRRLVQQLEPTVAAAKPCAVSRPSRRGVPSLVRSNELSPRVKESDDGQPGGEQTGVARAARTAPGRLPAGPP